MPPKVDANLFFTDNQADTGNADQSLTDQIPEKDQTDQNLKKDQTDQSLKKDQTDQSLTDKSPQKDQTDQSVKKDQIDLSPQKDQTDQSLKKDQTDLSSEKDKNEQSAEKVKEKELADQTAAQEKADKELADQTAKQEKADKELALRLASLIEHANSRVIPLTRSIRKAIEGFEAQKPDDREEDVLIKQLRPLIEQAEKILSETNGAVHGADPDNRLTNAAKRNMQDHKATPEEQRLAEALKVLVEEVGGTIEWAKDKLNSFPKAKRELGPLLDALGQPLTQIIGGVGLLLAGVLNLVGNLLKGLGLDSLLKGIVSATGLDKLYKGLGLGSWLKIGS